MPRVSAQIVNYDSGSEIVEWKIVNRTTLRLSQTIPIYDSRFTILRINAGISFSKDYLFWRASSWFVTITVTAREVRMPARSFPAQSRAQRSDRAAHKTLLAKITIGAARCFHAEVALLLSLPAIQWHPLSSAIGYSRADTAAVTFCPRRPHSLHLRRNHRRRPTASATQRKSPAK